MKCEMYSMVSWIVEQVYHVVFVKIKRRNNRKKDIYTFLTSNTKLYSFAFTNITEYTFSLPQSHNYYDVLI